MPYKLTNCLWCGDLFKDFPPGFIGDGRKGILRGFYSIKEFEGYAQQTASSVTAITIAPMTTSLFCYI